MNTQTLQRSPDICLVNAPSIEQPSTTKKRRAGRESSGIRTESSLTTGMTVAQKTEVDALMREIPEQWKSYRTKRTELGRALHKLQAAFAKAGKNGKFTRCLKELEIPKATAYELINRFKSVEQLPKALLSAADANAVDLGAPRIQARLENIRFRASTLTVDRAHEIIRELMKKPECKKQSEFGNGISEQEKKVYRLFNAMRKATGNLEAAEKKLVVQTALNLLANYDHIYTKAETLTITPVKAEDDWVLMPFLGKTLNQEVK